MTEDKGGKVTTGTDEWRAHLIEDRAGIARVVASIERAAVVGIKPDPPDGPAHFVPEHMQEAGITIVPVPVYFPDLQEVLGEPVHRSLATIDPPADTVVLFRRSADVPQHLDDILAAKPRTVWMQLGIRHAETAEALARAGIDVVQDRCLKVELARVGR